jgi:hypothetical protein
LGKPGQAYHAYRDRPRCSGGTGRHAQPSAPFQRLSFAALGKDNVVMHTACVT